MESFWLQLLEGFRQRLLDCDPERTVLLGDHHVDLRAAQAAKVKSCFCHWGLGHDDGLQADFQADQVTDLPLVFPSGEPS